MDWLQTRVKASCTVSVMLSGDTLESIVIGYTGGIVGDLNVWEQEMANSINCDDIFFDHPGPPEKPGFYVFEGTLEPVYEDAPSFDGVWRPATKEDMASLIKI